MAPPCRLNSACELILQINATALSAGSDYPISLSLSFHGTLYSALICCFVDHEVLWPELLVIFLFLLIFLFS